MPTGLVELDVLQEQDDEEVLFFKGPEEFQRKCFDSDPRLRTHLLKFIRDNYLRIIKYFGILIIFMITLIIVLVLAIIQINNKGGGNTNNNIKNLTFFVPTTANPFKLSNNSGRCGLECVTPESCICLTKCENDHSSSKPELNVQLKYSLKEINIFSEGSLIEVFGVHDEYLFTCAPELIDDWAGMAVYHAKIVLPGINTCKLKFTRLKEEGRLWLYSLQLSVVKTEDPSNNLLFNFDNVNKLINNSSQHLSEKAEKFRKFFELYAKNTSNTQPLSIQTFLDLINRECNVQFSDCKTLTSLLSACENLSTRKEANQVTRNELSLECQYIKGYIDKKLAEMKEDLMKCVENKLNELRDENNARLDHIVKLLESTKF